MPQCPLKGFTVSHTSFSESKIIPVFVLNDILLVSMWTTHGKKLESAYRCKMQRFSKFYIMRQHQVENQNSKKTTILYIEKLNNRI